MKKALKIILWLFGTFVVLAKQGTTMVWDYDAALEIIAQSQRGTVVAVLCGTGMPR